jgi:uncharacterized membrane protein YccC
MPPLSARLTDSLRHTFALSGSGPSLRRGLLFLANVGAPAAAGLLLGEARAAFSAAMAGFLLTLVDRESDPLRRRLARLAAASVVLLACGYLGVRAEGRPWLFWPLFAGLVAAAGWAGAAGHSRLAGDLRTGSIALMATAGLPGSPIRSSVNATTGWFVLGVVAFGALTRVFDSRIPLPAGGDQPPPPGPAPGRGYAVRFTLAYAAAAAGGLLLGVATGAVRPYWVATTSLVVMQPDSGLSYRRVVQRIAGTLAGALAAWPLVHALAALPRPLAGWAAWAALLPVAFASPQGLPRNYWLHSALVTLLVFTLFDLAAYGRGVPPALFTERVRDVLIGCAFALLGTLLSSPRTGEGDTGQPAR